MPKNPVRTRVRCHRRRRDTNDMFTVLSSILRNRIVQVGGGKPTSILKFRRILTNIADDGEYWDNVKNLFDAAKKVNTALDLY